MSDARPRMFRWPLASKQSTARRPLMGYVNQLSSDVCLKCILKALSKR